MGDSGGVIENGIVIAASTQFYRNARQVPDLGRHRAEMIEIVKQLVSGSRNLPKVER
jgi:hypothetical protein